MKMLVIAIVLIGVYFIYHLTFGSVVASYQLCLDQENTAISASQNLTCGQKRIVFEDLTACIETVQESSMLGSFMYNFTNVQDRVNLLIGEHNKICKESTVKAPGEALYIK